MVGIENLAIIFALMAFNTIFLLIKRKDFATITVHLILMLFTFVIGATIIFPDNSVFCSFPNVLFSNLFYWADTYGEGVKI